MQLDQLLREETLDTVRYRGVVSVPPDASVGDAIDTMRREGTGCVLVCDDGRPVGIFTESDLLKLMAKSALNAEAPVRDHASVPVAAAGQNASIADAICMMQQGGHRRVAVVNEAGAAVGIVSMKQLVRHIAEHFPNAVLKLPPRADDFAVERHGA
jgi:CBS domain-containing protein